ncbi:MAG TPA: RNA methyltransferase [Patescibacteria group bacterium]|nr:RNA methyltransferase [Patescibacteria group bacterium]
MKIISSDSNPNIKNLIKLKKGRNLKLSDVFLIDGARELEIAIDSNIYIEKVYICNDFIKGNEKILNKIDKNIITYTSKSVFKKLAYKENPDGFLAIAKKNRFSVNDVNLKNEDTIIVLESIEKPGNLGAIIRTIYAAGIKTIVLANNQTDIYNPNTIRSSEGMIFKVKLIEESNLNILSWLKLNKFKIYSTSINSSNNYVNEKYKSRCALVFGSEASGLSGFWLKNCDQKIKIQMAPEIDSLNISVSVAIIVFEVLRQRGNIKT